MKFLGWLLVCFFLAIGAANSQTPVIVYCYNPAGSGPNQWIPCSATVPLSVAIAYPSGATPLTASTTGTTGATTATLTGTSTTTVYICWLSIRANANAAATANATVTGTITGTLNFTQWTAPNTSGLGVTEELFNPCVPASGTNQAISVVSAAPGTGGVVSVSAGGYYK